MENCVNIGSDIFHKSIGAISLYRYMKSKWIANIISVMKLTRYKNISVFEFSFFMKKDVSFFLVNNIPVRYIGNQYRGL